MDYKKEIENFLNEVQSEKFLKFLYNVIGGINMDYRKEIIEMIQKIHNETMIKFIYGCVKRAYRGECSEE